MHIGFWWKIQKERDHYEDMDVDAIILKRVLEKYDGVVWNGLIWLRTDMWPALVNSIMNLRILFSN
jgi:hypothetical protein